MLEFTSKSIEDTKECAKVISKRFLSQNTKNIIILNGDLGSGKTTLCQHIVNFFLECEIQVISPTFNILNIYTHKNHSIYHYDLYRIKQQHELQELAIEDAFCNILTLIEWPSLILRYLPKNFITIDIADDCVSKIIKVSKSNT